MPRNHDVTRTVWVDPRVNAQAKPLQSLDQQVLTVEGGGYCSSQPRAT